LSPITQPTGSKPRIDSLDAFSERGLVQLKQWLEPWFIPRIQAGAQGVTSGVGDHDLFVLVDGSGSAITTGVKADCRVDFNCRITKATLLSDIAGNVVWDVWKDTFANYPPTVADSICASAKPTLSANDHSENSTLTGWNTTINAGDTFRFNIDSVATITRVILVLHLEPPT
jgi:hypothetical protein